MTKGQFVGYGAVIVAVLVFAVWARLWWLVAGYVLVAIAGRPGQLARRAWKGVK